MLTATEKVQMLRRQEVESLVGLFRSSIYERLNPKSKYFDPSFPIPVRFGSSVRWRLTEIQQWVEAKASLRIPTYYVS